MKQISYRRERDKYWNRFYPTARVIFGIFTFFGWFLLILSFSLLIIVIIGFTNSGQLTAFQIQFSVSFFVTLFINSTLGIVLLFTIRECIRFFVDRNFYLFASNFNEISNYIESGVSYRIEKTSSSKYNKEIAQMDGFESIQHFADFVIEYLRYLEKDKNLLIQKLKPQQVDDSELKVEASNGKYIVYFKFGEDLGEGKRRLMDITKVERILLGGNEVLYT